MSGTHQVYCLSEGLFAMKTGERLEKERDFVMYVGIEGQLRVRVRRDSHLILVSRFL